MEHRLQVMALRLVLRTQPRSGDLSDPLPAANLLPAVAQRILNSLMHCIVTAGPTYEPLDSVRRLTNFSTGRLGSELVNFLAAKGHELTLLIGQQATYRGVRHPQALQTFSTTTDLRERLRALSTANVGAIFHAAAVSDFFFGEIWRRSADGQLHPLSAGKISTRDGTLLAELLPTPKIIFELRNWFPQAKIIGWKYEVDDGRDEVIRKGLSQINECRTDACVVNGPAYGNGFGMLDAKGQCTHCDGMKSLFETLETFIRSA